MPPLTVLIKPASGRCNMRCRYCFYVDEMQNRDAGVRPDMTAADADALVRRAFVYAEGFVSFVFQGGEPTLAGLPYFEAFAQSVRRHNTRGLEVRCALQTNGYDLSDELIAFFKRHNFLLGVSMDGDQRLHDALRSDAHGQGTHARVQNTMKRLQKAGVDVNILCVVSRPVAEQPDRVWDALAPYKYLQFIACLDGLNGETGPWSVSSEAFLTFLRGTFRRYVQAIDRGQYVSVRWYDNWVRMLRGFAPDTCSMQGHCVCGFTVESDLSAYPCDFYALDEWKLGSLKTESFARLVKSEIARRFIQDSLPVPDACRACEWYALCRNGCRRERAQGLHRFCQAYQMFFPEAMPDLQRIARMTKIT